MKSIVVTVILAFFVKSAQAEIQVQAHYGLQGHLAEKTPEVLKDQAGKSPELSKQGSPALLDETPDNRRKDYKSSLKFEDASQCYSVAKNLVHGDEFLLEAWVYASQENDEGWHAIVANGNGGSGFLLAQHDDQWAVLVGGVGTVNLGNVDAKRWTHLAIVKTQGTVTGWIDGKRVANLPNVGGGAENFSIGATAPGREGFQGLIAEVRYATFLPGKFDSTADFLGNPKPPRRSVVPTGPEPAAATQSLQTQHATFGFNDRGYLISITARQSGKQYCPGNHPSPVLSLHENGQPNDKLQEPVSARFDLAKKVIELKYATGAIATVKAEAKDMYLRFELASLEPRGKVDNIVWGPIRTKIAGKIGDMLGVVRDDDWAIGLYGLDDNTISGPVVDGDCYTMGYFIHAPNDEVAVPRKYKEGQFFNIGGDGKSDVAYFSHPEEYFQYICGTGAKLEPEFGSSIAYHARDRRLSYVHHWSLLGGGFEAYRARKLVSDPLPGVDFLGSSVALYACHEEQGLATLEKITLGEKLPYITDQNGVWIRDPASYRATVYWHGAMDKAIEYTKALGYKDISRDTGEWYASRTSKWTGQVGFKGGKTMTYKEFGELANQQGMTHGGLHTLCMFLQGGISSDVTPVPSERLQTVCRTKLAKDISETDTEIVVTDPSFLADKGTWQVGDNSNFLRIGGEMLHFKSISDRAPWTLQGVKRGHASKAAPHKAGEEVAKLMQNCYNGFAPDMQLMLDYADFYAEMMHRNGMEIIDFDGFESTVYQHHGYYAVRVFCRRLFESYHKLTGKWPRVTTSNVFPGSWEYIHSCNIGGGGHMFDVRTGRRATQGKDIGNGWSNSYYPGTFGKQGWSSSWSLYDAQNLEAKAVGWDATYAINISQEGLDATGERDEIFKAFRAWNEARAKKIFTKAQKQKLRDPDYKFHLEKNGNQFTLYPIKEIHGTTIVNPSESQPLQCAMKCRKALKGFSIILPDGQKLQADRQLQPGEFVICKGNQAYVADVNRKKIAELDGFRELKLPAGESKFTIEAGEFEPTVFIVGSGEKL